MLASALLWTARVASLNLCADEYLLLLARPPEIASLSYLSSDPAESALWRQARPFPRNAGTLETALASRPDLVLTMGGGGRATGLIARRLGLRVLDLRSPASLADVAANLRQVASALGEPARASSQIARLAMLQRSPPPRAEDAIFVANAGQSLAPDSLGARWLRLAGFRQRSLPGNRLSLETLAANPPKWLIVSNYRSDQQSRGRDWLRHPLVQRAASRRLVADGRRWTCAGPTMIDEVERLRRRG
ncbi:ABC transporter substrate-binding protein [Sphingomonas ginkgonis]|uniref:ABC transporter substrate-binding protein n=1 Tax=Sphingomonas ginkgonis TaxID=2315330 RepID=UPI001EEFE759|nr:hypothetical protein [Sphingomonas ginkgonis]